MMREGGWMCGGRGASKGLGSTAVVVVVKEEKEEPAAGGAAPRGRLEVATPRC